MQFSSEKILIFTFKLLMYFGLCATTFMLQRSGFLHQYICDIIILLSYFVFATTLRKDTGLVYLTLIPWLMLAVFGAAVNYQSLYPIIIPFCILFVCLSLAIVISIKKQNVKVAMALTFISIVLIAVKNIYIAPMYYYDKGDMSIPQNANFIKDTENFFYTTSSLDTLSLTKYNNKVLYIELWYSYCLPCIKKLPLIKKINEKYRDREDFVVIGIIDGKLDDIKSFKKMNIEYKDVFDVSLLANKELITKLHQKLGVSVYPIELIIDKSGKIISIHLGYQEPLTDYYYKKTTNTINALLNEK